MATISQEYTASATITISPENVATSATRVAGVESGVVSNISNKYLDVLVSGKWTAGTSPTGGQLDVWVYAPISDDLASSVTYPDAIDGTSSAETISSENVRNGGMKLATSVLMDTTTDRTYPIAPFSVASLFGGVMPSRWGLFLSHNSGVNSNSTGGNHAWSYIGLKISSA